MEKADFQEVSMAFEEIRSIVRECGGKFQFDKHEDCVGVRVQSYDDKEPYPFRVVEIIVDEDDDVILFGDDFSEEVWESTFPDEVIGDGMIRIADALRRAVRKDYISLIGNLREEMSSELWRVIEAHKDDERCYCPRQFGEVSFTHKHFCDVDLNGCTYDVDAVKLSKWASGSIRVDIVANGMEYSVYNVEEIAGILHAVRNTLSIPA